MSAIHQKSVLLADGFGADAIQSRLTLEKIHAPADSTATAFRRLPRPVLT
jgi:hypothetical protein